MYTIDQNGARILNELPWIAETLNVTRHDKYTIKRFQIDFNVSHTMVLDGETIVGRYDFVYPITEHGNSYIIAFVTGEQS